VPQEEEEEEEEVMSSNIGAVHDLINNTKINL